MVNVGKRKAHIIADSALFILLISLISIGILLKFRLPDQCSDASILGLTHSGWSTIHFGISIVFVMLIGFHISLELPKIKQVVYPQDPAKRQKAFTLFSVGVYLLIVLSLFLFFLPVNHG